MKIGITGPRGFIGGHLVDTLKEKAELSFFDRPEYDLLSPIAIPEQDVIIHTAAVNRGTDQEIISGSVVATYNLIQAVEKHKSKIIYLSSVHAETNSVYGLSKRLTEIMLEDFCRENNNPVTILRITNVFGERARLAYNSVVATFCHQVANNEKLTVKDNKKINFIYVKDLVKIISTEVLAKRKRLFTLKKIQPNNQISVSELAEVITSFKDLKKKPKSKFYQNLYRTYQYYEAGNKKG